VKERARLFMGAGAAEHDEIAGCGPSTRTEIHDGCVAKHGNSTDNANDDCSNIQNYFHERYQKQNEKTGRLALLQILIGPLFCSYSLSRWSGLAKACKPRAKAIGDGHDHVHCIHHSLGQRLG
jgi:hypothetical protein